MTTDTLADSPETADPQPEPSYTPESDGASRLHLLVSFAFLLEALLAGLLLAARFVEPDLLGDVAFLSSGRLQPVATHLFVYGWVTIGLLGAAYYVLPRVSGAPLRSPGRAGVALVLLTVGYAAGAVGIALGMSEGRRLLEAPLWADVIVLAGLLAAASIVTATVRQRTDLGPAQWYFTAATWWLVLLHVVGNIPGVAGVGSALQTSFYRAGLIGLWVAAAGVGVVYYVIPRLTGRTALAPTQMSVIGLWSLAFVWALTAPSDLTYGPTPDWLDTVSVIFAIGMVIPVAVIIADVVTAMRGRWVDVSGTITIRYLMAGAVALGLIPAVNLLVALRGPSTVVGFTDWAPAIDFLAVGLAATFWLLAYVAVAAPDLRIGGPPLTRWPYRVTVLGGALFVAGLLLGGALAGLTWLGGANSGVYANTGDGFQATARALEGIYVMRLVGYAIYAYGLFWFALSLVRRRALDASRPVTRYGSDIELDPEVVLRKPLRLGSLAGTGLALFGAAVLFAFVVPALETGGAEPTLLADEHRLYVEGTAAAEGREVYLREGCQVCHTQAVRPIVTDVGLGAVGVPGDYAHEVPAAIGSTRVGPDLMHAAAGSVAADAAALEAYLVDPRAVRSWSIMPAYAHLSDADRDALVAYILTLD